MFIFIIFMISLLVETLHTLIISLHNTNGLLNLVTRYSLFLFVHLIQSSFSLHLMYIFPILSEAQNLSFCVLSLLITLSFHFSLHKCKPFLLFFFVLTHLAHWLTFITPSAIPFYLPGCSHDLSAAFENLLKHRWQLISLSSSTKNHVLF